MNILAIETTSAFASAAVIDGTGNCQEVIWDGSMTHLQNLLPLVDEALKKTGIELSEIKAVAVSRGPGSFTGIRIGMATAKALAQVAKIPVIPVPTLLAMAYGMRHLKGIVCPILDARRGQVYATAFSFGRDAAEDYPPQDLQMFGQVLFREGAYFPEEVLSLLSGDEPVFFMGDGIGVYQEKIRAAMGESAVFLPLEQRFQKAGAVAEIGYAMYTRGEVESYITAQPEYLRQSEAERNLQKKRQQEKEQAGKI